MDSEQDRIDEQGFTSFQGSRDTGAIFTGGRIRQFFAKFFTKKGQDELKKDSFEGDTIRTLDVPKQVKPDEPSPITPGYLISKSTVYLPEIEKNRKERYRKYEEMDDYPEIGSAFDIYADDVTQKSSTNERWIINTEYEFINKEVKRFFTGIRMDRFYWDIVRNVCKFGDCFIETIVDINRPKKGIQRIKVLNPNFIVRAENEYGYLERFLQQIPQKDEMMNAPGPQDMFAQSKFINLDKNQIVHFRLYTSDPSFYPYGKSVAANAVRVFRSLRLMEDAMLIYRLSRAPERRVFYIDVGSLPTSKAEIFIERIKEKFKKEKFYNSNTGSIDARYNPLSADEDFYVPHRDNKGTKIDVLPGAQNLGDVDDVKYFRDKLLAAMKIPKDYVVEKDKSPERKANLSQLDAKFARVITRVQKNIEVGLETLVKRHLTLMGFEARFYKDLQVNLPDPSDIFAKRKLELEDIKANVVQTVAATQLFSKKYIYKNFYNMTDSEIEKLEEELKQDATEMQQQQAVMGQQQMGGGLGIGPDAGVPPPADPSMGEQPALGGSEAEPQPQQKSKPKESTEFEKLMKLVEKYEIELEDKE